MSKQNPTLSKDCVVNVAGIWVGGYYSYPGRSDILLYQKSAGAILCGQQRAYQVG